jgi:hypothetical protein
MEKSSVTALVVTILLTTLLVGMQAVEVAEANPSQTPILTPKVSILSPQNDSYFNVSIEGVSFQLIYETNTVLSWVGYSIGGNGYSIEGKGSGNVTVSENGTLVRDFGSSGYHTLTLYANDTSGNWATPQTVTYLVNFGVEPTPPLSPSPSQTQQPTTEHSPTPAPTTTQKVGQGLTDFQLLLIIGLLVTAIIIGVGVALNIKYKKNNPRKQS